MFYSYKQLLLPALIVVFIISLKVNKQTWMIIFAILRKCWFPLFTVFIAIFIYTGTAQGRNIINEAEFARSGTRKFTTILALWLWAYNSYKLSAAALQHSAPGKLTNRKGKNLSSIAAALFGILPWITAIVVMTVSKENPDYKIVLLLVAGLWLFIIYLLLLSAKEAGFSNHGLPEKTLNRLSLYLFYFYRKITRPIIAVFNQLPGIKTKKETAVITSSKLKPSFYFKPDGEIIINWGGHLFLYFLIGGWPIFFGRLFGPIGLVFFALSCFTILGTLFEYIKKRFGYPVLPIFLIAVIVFTTISDNNNAGFIDPAKQDNRESLENNFESWIRGRAATEDTITINLVSAEGGGLRSAFWTYAVLRKLQLDHPDFYKQLYAISSVSGGSVGAALYCTEQFTGLSDRLDKAPILNNDNLSPMIAALFYREVIQSVIPMDIDLLDRSRVMDATFETFWENKHAGSKLWSDNFLDLWQHQKRIPALFINSIHVENGENVILSNLSFDQQKLQCTDMFQLAGNSLSLSQVAGISSRFPYLQPAARFKFPDGNTWGHLADGGYFENSGVYTIYRVYLHLRERLSNMKWNGSIPVVKFSILLVSNGDESRPSQPGYFLNEMGSPLNTLLNSWYTKGYSYANIARETIHLINSNDRFFEIRLDRKKSTIPLGWFLSVNSRNEIIRQAEGLMNTADYKAYSAFSF